MGPQHVDAYFAEFLPFELTAIVQQYTNRKVKKVKTLEIGFDIAERLFNQVSVYFSSHSISSCNFQ